MNVYLCLFVFFYILEKVAATKVVITVVVLTSDILAVEN